MAFTQRILSFKFTLAQGTFANGANTLDVTNLRASVRINNAGNVYGQTQAMVQIWGLTLDVMNRLSTLGMAIDLINRNFITISAGDAINGVTKIFYGNITWSFADFTQMPNVPFQIVAFALGDQSVLGSQATSLKGNQDAAAICSALCGRMNLPFQNVGVNAQISNPYLWGPLRWQLVQVIQAVDAGWNQGEDGTVRIWPRGQNNGLPSVLVSKDTGMIGAPTYTANGILVKTIFNPGVRAGTQLQIVSDNVPMPAGQSWNVYSVQYSLDAQFPRGEWSQTVQATRPQNVAGVPT